MMASFKERLSVLGLTDEQTAAVEDVFSQTVEEFVGEVRSMIAHWESVVEDDQSLYTLGLRRSIDMVQGTVAHEQLPILETEDTPEE
jgi:hypothetical protein